MRSIRILVLVLVAQICFNVNAYAQSCCGVGLTGSIFPYSFCPGPVSIDLDLLVSDSDCKFKWTGGGGAVDQFYTKTYSSPGIYTENIQFRKPPPGSSCTSFDPDTFFTLQIIIFSKPVLDEDVYQVCSGMNFVYSPESTPDTDTWEWINTAGSVVPSSTFPTSFTNSSGAFPMTAETTTVTIIPKTLNLCSDTLLVDFIVAPLPNASLIDTSAFLCSNTELNIDFSPATDPVSEYDWRNLFDASMGDGPSISFTPPANDSDTIRTDPILIGYTIQGWGSITITSDECVNPDTDTFFARIYPTPKLLSTLTDSMLCSQDSFHFELLSNLGAGVGTFNWTAQIGSIEIGSGTDSNSIDLLIDASSTAAEVLELTIIPVGIFGATPDLCYGDTIAMSLTINPIPELVLPVDTSLCSGGEINLNLEDYLVAAVPSEFFWQAIPDAAGDIAFTSNPAGSSSNVFNDVLTIVNPLVSAPVDQLYKVGVKNAADNKCNSDTLLFSIAVTPSPEPPTIAIEQVGICHSSNNILVQIVDASSTDLNYRWSISDSAAGNSILNIPGHNDFAWINIDTTIDFTVSASAYFNLACESPKFDVEVELADYEASAPDFITIGKVTDEVSGTTLYVSSVSDAEGYIWGLDDYTTDFSIPGPPNLTDSIPGAHGSLYNHGSPLLNEEDLYALTYKGSCFTRNYYRGIISGIEPAFPLSAELVLYPNPSSGGNFSIEGVNLNGIFKLEIVDLSGAMIGNQVVHLRGTNQRIAFEGVLESGLYLVVLSNESGILYTKLVVN